MVRRHSFEHIIVAFACSIIFWSRALCGFTIATTTPRPTSSWHHQLVRAVKSDLVSSLTEQHGLDDRFGRWRYLQNVLDDEDEVIPWPILSFVARRALEENDPLSEDGLNEDRMQIIQRLFPPTHATVAESDEAEVRDMLDALLPDEYDEEDAFKSLWDMVRDIHGVTAVKMDLQDPSWRLRCAVVRLILHYDFLARGLEV